MNIRNVLDARKFSTERAVKESMVDSDRLLCDIHCLSPGQSQKPHTHKDSDKVYFVVEGCGHFQIGENEFEVGEKNLVHAPAGVVHCVKNESPGNLVLLVFMAPRP